MHISGGQQGGGFIPAEYDEKLLPYLDEFLHKNNGYVKQYYTIHLYGTHEAYKSRYPSAFAQFSAEDEEGDDSEQKQTKAEYDNAVLYDDYVVNEIINRFEDKNAIVFFISDHGMDLYDTSANAQHTAEKKRSRHMIEVPFVVWASEQYRKNYPLMWERIKNSVHKPYRTDYLMYAILDAAGVEYKGMNPAYSIFSKDFVEFERIYGGANYIKQ